MKKLMNRELLTLKIVREIIALMVSGGYADGQRMPSERKLSQDFAVSRGTIRKALCELEKMGAIEIKPGSGVYARKISPGNIPDKVLPRDFHSVSIADIVQARIAIETASLRSACRRITADELSKIRQAVLKMDENIDNLGEFIKQDMLFHELIVRASGNVALVTAFEAISQYHRYSQIFTSSDQQCEAKAYGYHKKIYVALEQKNEKLAIKAMSEHLNDMKLNAKIGI